MLRKEAHLVHEHRSGPFPEVQNHSRVLRCTTRVSSSMWEPVRLTDTTGTLMSYSIPKSAGGMTTHYKGVSYWTLQDTVASLQIRESEMSAISFVLDKTEIACGSFDHRYHTHDRSPDEPAEEAETASFPACLYGTCRGKNCSLDQAFAVDIGVTEKAAMEDWFRGSSLLEFGKDGLITDAVVTSLLVANGRATGVIVEQGKFTRRVCSNIVLLAAGVWEMPRCSCRTLAPLSFSLSQ